MKSKTFFQLLLLFVSLGFNITNSFGQGGSIEGVVFDAKTKETLVGAQILIQGTTTGTTTNFNGEFRISNIQADEIELLVRFISYQPIIIEGIKIERGLSAELMIEMHEVSHQLDGVVVEARRTTHTETALIASLRNSQVVTSGISAQQISRSQDSDAAQVVRRIPGVTIIEDRFIIVRGLSERYNSVMLHDVYAPSMEPDVRSFSFDIIPSSQIEQLLISKSPSPHLPGDFAGGAIQIITKSIPDRTSIEASYSSTYDDGTSFQPFYNTNRHQTYWTGFGQSYFNLPNSFPEDIRNIGQSTSQLETYGNSLKNNWIPTDGTAFLNQSFSLTGNFRKRWAGMNVGNITTLNYSHSYSNNEIRRSDFNAYNHGIFNNAGDMIVEPHSLPIYNFEDKRYSNSVRLGVLHNWGLEINRYHRLEIINLFNQMSSYNYVNRMGEHLDFGVIMNNHNFQQVFRGLYSGQVKGKHQILENTDLDWTAGLNTSYREMPDYKQFRTDRSINDPDGYFSIYVPMGGAQPYFMGRFYSSMNETGNSFALNISHQILMSALSSEPVMLKAGIFSDRMERDFRARNIGYTSHVLAFPQDLRRVRIDSLFSEAYLNIYSGDGVLKIDEQSNPQDSYSTANNLHAWYSMIHLPIADSFNMSGGLRTETNQRILTSATTSGPVELDNVETHHLWSVNMNFNITSDLLLRGAYGQTLNRPELRELAPFGFFDFDNNWVVRGNEFLKTSTVDNYDLRLEFYPSHSEVISIGAFYKKFDNAIERVVLVGAGSGGSKNFSFGNADHALVYGLEVEAKKNLVGLTSSNFLDQISLYFNGTMQNSEVSIGSGSRSDGRDTDPRPLQGQSPYIINAGIYYNNIDNDLQVNILYNIIGKRLFTGGFRELDGKTISYPDVYELPRNVLDITVSKRLNQSLSLKAGVSDILNQPITFIQDANEDGQFDKNTDQLLRYYRPGMRFSLSLSYGL